MNALVLAIKLRAPLFAALVLDIVSLGLPVYHFGKLGRREAICAAFIPGTTAGYGDYLQARIISRFITTFIAVLDLIIFYRIGVHRCAGHVSRSGGTS